MSTKDQLADGLTKPLLRIMFDFLPAKTDVTECDMVLPGHIESMKLNHNLVKGSITLAKS